jgi:hypothetical protein
MFVFVFLKGEFGIGKECIAGVFEGDKKSSTFILFEQMEPVFE